MSTTLSNCMTEMSKQIGDYWSSTATGDGAVGGTTVVDALLMEFMNAWVGLEAHDRITSGTYDEEERYISSLSNTAGTLTTIAHGGQILTNVTYEVHRVASASDKRICLIRAARNCFPDLYTQIADVSKSISNWLRNPNFEVWASASYPDYCRVSAVTAAENTTAPYVRFGSSSCKLSTAAGYMYTTNTLVPDFQDLAGQTVTFTSHVWCDTASAVRLAIYDGTTTTYSDYHPGTSDWTESSDPLEVSATIADTPTSVEFRWYLAKAAATAYIDDARVIGPRRNKYYIGDLGFHKDTPNIVQIEPSQYSQAEPWKTLRDWWVDNDKYLHLPATLEDYRLRLRGTKVLDFLASGVSSTDWAATIDIDQPQVDILVAQAVIELCNQFMQPNQESATTDRWERAKQIWQLEYKERVGRHGMDAPEATVSWG